MLMGFGNNKVSYRQVTEEYIRRDANFRVPMDGNFVKIKHAHQLTPPIRNTFNFAIPQIVDKKWGLLTTYAGRVYDYVSMSDPWCFFLRDFLDWQSQYLFPLGEFIESYKVSSDPGRTYYRYTPGSLLALYVLVTQAHQGWTDASSRESGAADPVTGINVRPGNKNYSFLMRPTAGNVHKLLRRNGTRNVIEALDVTKPPPTVASVVARPWLMYAATQADGMKDKSGQPQTVSRYPHTKEANAVWGLPVAGLMMPLLSMGGEFEIDRVNCIDVENGAAWSPYVPEV